MVVLLIQGNSGSVKLALGDGKQRPRAGREQGLLGEGALLIKSVPPTSPQGFGGGKRDGLCSPGTEVAGCRHCSGFHSQEGALALWSQCCPPSLSAAAGFRSPLWMDSCDRYPSPTSIHPLPVCGPGRPGPSTTSSFQGSRSLGFSEIFRGSAWNPSRLPGQAPWALPSTVPSPLHLCSS